MTEPDNKVQVAYLHNQQVSHAFMESMRAMLDYDRAHGQHIAPKPLNIVCGSGRLVPSRNYAATLFLDKTPHEWLMFIDSDMGFGPDSVAELLAVADPVKAPVVGGLCFAAMLSGYDGMGGFRQTIVPTMYGIGTQVDTGRVSFCYWGPYPRDTVVQVAGTGAAFLLIHRGVLERMRADSKPGGDHWFDQLYDQDDDVVGEDIAFCLRTLQLDIPVHVHTGVRTTHHKAGWIGEDDYARQQGPAAEDSPEVNRLTALVAHLQAKLARSEVAA